MIMTFQEAIAEPLACGREIEFSCHDKQYSITNWGGYWYFCCDTEDKIIEKICPFEDKTALIACVTAFCIGDTPLPLLFERGDARIIGIL